MKRLLLFGAIILLLGIGIVASWPPPAYTAHITPAQQAVLNRHGITTFASGAVACTVTDCVFNMSYGNETDVFHTSELHLMKYLRRGNSTVGIPLVTLGTYHDQAIQQYVNETVNAWAAKDARDALAAANAPPVTILRQGGQIVLGP